MAKQPLALECLPQGHGKRRGHPPALDVRPEEMYPREASVRQSPQVTTDGGPNRFPANASCSFGHAF
jgi:hypothetical protein